jgi:hypothetical protein
MREASDYTVAVPSNNPSLMMMTKEEKSKFICFCDETDTEYTTLS